MILRHYDIQNVKDRMQIQLDKIGIERETRFLQVYLRKIQENFKKISGSIWEKVRKLRLSCKRGFLVKKYTFAFTL